jgi:hypothetical protein
MFRTTIKALSLFRKNNSYRYGSDIAFKTGKKPTLHNDGFNMFMLSAFVKESTNINSKNNKNSINSKETKYIDNNEVELKIICQITGCEKNKNNKDCSCEKVCIVKKSEISMICDLLQ